jgi:predicted extracellular nuclease
MKLKPYCLNLFNQQSVAAVRLRKLLPTFTDLPRAAIFLTLFISVSLASVNAQKNRAIGEVQGDKNVSPFTGEQVRVSGIVTARLRAGFFIQTPDDKIDANPNTS